MNTYNIQLHNDIKELEEWRENVVFLIDDIIRKHSHYFDTQDLRRIIYVRLFYKSIRCRTFQMQKGITYISQHSAWCIWTPAAKLHTNGQIIRTYLLYMINHFGRKRCDYDSREVSRRVFSVSICLVVGNAAHQMLEA